MALRFRIEHTKTKPRVAVLRINRDEQGIEKLEPVGSFGQRHNADDIRPLLSEDELYEFDNFVSTIEFGEKYFEAEADTLDRFIVKVPPAFKEVLFKLWKMASRFDIEFIPEKEMLYHLLNKAKEIEKTINAITNKRIQLLENFAIDIDKIEKPHQPDKDSQKLFQALLELDIPLEKLSKDFEDIAHKIYGKTTRFEPHFFKFYAENPDNKRFPQWYYTIAIDLLLRYDVNPITLIDAHKIARHWSRLKIQKWSLEKAKDQFIKQFNPPKKVIAKCFDTLMAAWFQYREK